MLIPIKKLNYFRQLNVTGVLHIGAHEGEENAVYKAFTLMPITWIEAQAETAAKLEAKISDPDRVLHAAIGEYEGLIVDLFVTNNSQSTSLLELGTHQRDYPDIKVLKIEKVRTSRIDTLYKGMSLPNFVNIDIQGAELQALKGFGHRLSEIDVLYLEVNYKSVYVGCPHVAEMDDYLAKYGFKRVATQWILGKGWGDAIYLQKRLARNLFIFRILQFPTTTSEYFKQMIQIIKNKLMKYSQFPAD